MGNPKDTKTIKSLVEAANMIGDANDITEADKFATFFKDTVAPMPLRKGAKYRLGDLLVTVSSAGQLFRSGDYQSYGVSYSVSFPHPRNARNTIAANLSMLPNGGFRLNAGGAVIMQATEGGFGKAQTTKEYDWFLNHRVNESVTEAKSRFTGTTMPPSTIELMKKSEEMLSDLIRQRDRLLQDTRRDPKDLGAQSHLQRVRIEIDRLMQTVDRLKSEVGTSRKAVTEAASPNRRLSKLKDIKVGDIFYQMLGHGDQMPQFYIVKSLDNKYGMEYPKGTIPTMNITFVRIGNKLKPTYAGMAGTAVPDPSDQEVGITFRGSAQEHSFGKKDSMVLVTISMGRDVPKAQLWDGKPVPYTAWG
jgi:hypothetical protein